MSWKTAANVALFQAGWFTSVLGAAHGHPYLGPLVVGGVLVVHFFGFRVPGDGALVVASTVVGVVAESLLAASGLVSYGAEAGVPLWIVGLWSNFAITLNHSLSWLGRSLLLAAAAGAVAGPAAYWAGARLGAIELVSVPGALLALAAVWACALPLLFLFARRLSRDARFGPSGERRRKTGPAAP